MALNAENEPTMSPDTQSPIDMSNALQARIGALTPLTMAKPVPVPSRGVDYRGKVVLAPMVRSGELPSRLLALHYGADLVWGPETVDRSMIGTTVRKNPRTGCLEWTRPPTQHAHSKPSNNANPDLIEENIIFKISPDRESNKFVFQIGTNDPERAVQAAGLVAPYCAGIDVNAGCPKPFSTSGGMGAALLKTEEGDLLARILRALVADVGQPHQIGISVKIRLLETPEKTSALVHKLCQTGITGLTIHCRTTPMRPRERAIRDQLRMIGAICHSYGVACLMNGDVTSRDGGLQLAREFNVDGAMIATAAEANSSVFRTQAEGGKLPWREVVQQYLKFCVATENKFGNTKFLLSQLISGKEPEYLKIMQSRSYAEIFHTLSFDEHNQEMMEDAKKVDAILKLDVPKTTKADVKRANKEVRRQQQNAAELKGREEVSAGFAGERAAKNSLKRQRSRSTSPVQRQSTSHARPPQNPVQIAVDNAGFDGMNHESFERAAAAV